MSRIIKSTRFIRITPDTCRICLRDLQRNLLKDLSEFAENLQTIEQKTLAELYENSTGYRISEPPGSPTKICLVCEANLIKLYTFKQEIDEAEASLIQLLRGQQFKEERTDEETEDPNDMSIEQLEPEQQLEDENIYMEQVDDEDGEVTQDEQEIQILESDYVISSNEPNLSEERLEVELHDDNLLGGPFDKTVSENEEKCAVQMITLPQPDMFKRRFKKDATVEKVHECQLCPMKFKTATQLRQHHITHSDERNFECSICFKRFKTRKTLKGHEEIHSTDLNYVCIICNHGYSNKTALRVHYGRRHGLKKLKTTLPVHKVVLDMLKDDIE